MTESDRLVHAVQRQYAPYYSAQIQRACKAMDGLGGRKRQRMGARTDAYFIRPGQTAHAACTLDAVYELLDSMFEVPGTSDDERQRIETACNAVQTLLGLERGLHIELHTQFGAKGFDAMPQDERMRGAPLELDEARAFLDDMQRDVDQVIAQPTAPDMVDRVRELPVEILNV